MLTLRALYVLSKLLIGSLLVAIFACKVEDALLVETSGGSGYYSTYSFHLPMLVVLDFFVRTVFNHQCL